jgi:hypothetical protein
MVIATRLGDQNLFIIANGKFSSWFLFVDITNSLPIKRLLRLFWLTALNFVTEFKEPEYGLSKNFYRKFKL